MLLMIQNISTQIKKVDLKIHFSFLLGSGSRIPFSLRLVYACLLCLNTETPGYTEPMYALLSYCRSQLGKSKAGSLEAGHTPRVANMVDKRTMRLLNLKNDFDDFDQMFTEVNLDSEKDLTDDDVSVENIDHPLKVHNSAPFESLNEETWNAVWTGRIERVTMNIVNRLVLIDDYIGALNLLREIAAHQTENIFLIQIVVRILMQMGSVETGKTYMKQIEKSISELYGGSAVIDLMESNRLTKKESKVVLNNWYSDQLYHSQLKLFLGLFWRLQSLILLKPSIFLKN